MGTQMRNCHAGIINRALLSTKKASHYYTPYDSYLTDLYFLGAVIV